MSRAEQKQESGRFLEFRNLEELAEYIGLYYYTPPRRSEPQQRTAFKSGLTWAAAGPASRAVWPPPCADG